MAQGTVLAGQFATSLALMSSAVQALSARASRGDAKPAASPIRAARRSADPRLLVAAAKACRDGSAKEVDGTYAGRAREPQGGFLPASGGVVAADVVCVRPSSRGDRGDDDVGGGQRGMWTSSSFRPSGSVKKTA